MILIMEIMIKNIKSLFSNKYIFKLRKFWNSKWIFTKINIK